MLAHFFTSCEDKLTYQGVDNINVEDKKEMLISVFDFRSFTTKT